MKYANLAAATLAALSLCRPAAALVQPQQGHLLPDFDVRERGVLPGATVVAGDEDLLPSPLRPAIPGPGASEGQRAAVARLKAARPALVAELLPETGLPRHLHDWGRPLTTATDRDPVLVARDFLKANADLFLLSNPDVDALQVVRNYATHDVFRTVWLGQSVDGILVDDGAVRFNLDRQGRILWVSAGALRPGLQVDFAGAMGPDEAVLAAAEHVGVKLAAVPARRTSPAAVQQVYDRGPFLSEIVAEPIVFPLRPSGAVLAWRVLLEPEPQAWYAVTVDARGGRLLRRGNLYKFVTNAGLVFNGNYPDAVPATHVNGVPQTQQSFGWRWPSTAGWTLPAPWGQFNLTVGNNVEAKEDRVGDNETTIGAFADGGALQEFLFPFQNLWATVSGSTLPARSAAASGDLPPVITNLFYWNNLWHDNMHRLGFDEGAGNFQHDNFSRGGCGRDSVRADAWDAIDRPAPNTGLNNANFGTPAESATCAGSPRPRMQQYLTLFPSNNIPSPSWLADTSLDADVIIHEYSHGTSHRLVGGPFTNCLDVLQSGAMGEGWGDWYAASYFSDPVMGEYSFADPVAGVREFPMNGNPRTYADLCDTGCQVHHDGEVHAATLWDMRTLVGKDVAEQLVTDAMKFVPCSPTYPLYRDALLMADQARYGGAHHCLIWQAYFGRGVGMDADDINGALPIADFVFNGTRCTGQAHPRYDSHATSDASGGNGDGLFAVGEVIDLNVVLHNRDGVITATGVSATVTTSTPGVTMVVATRTYPNLPAGGSAGPTSPFQFRIEPGFVCGQRIDFQVQISWATFTRTPDSFSESGGWVPGAAIFRDGAEGTPLAVSGQAGVVSGNANTGTRSYYMDSGCFAGIQTDCSNPGPCADTCSHITLPSITLPGGQGAAFSFWASYNNEEGWDGLYVEASPDGGATWDFLDTMSYNGILSAYNGGCDIGDIPGINGPPGNGGLSPWTRFEGSLARYVGQTIILRIAHHHDVCLEFEGAYVDDIAIDVRNCQTAPFVNAYLSARANDDTVNGACTDSDSFPDPGETVAVALTVTNSGNATAAGLTGTLTTTHPGITILPSATQGFGDLASGGSATRTFSYTVASSGVGCFEAADFQLALTANGGAFTATDAFSETLRQDATVASWFDDFEGGQPAWTASLGPDGTQQDFALRQMACWSTTGTNPCPCPNTLFWSTNLNINTGGCGSGEPDYSADSDSLLTSPTIDLGAPGAQITRITWQGAPPNFVSSWGDTVNPGFVEVQVDHDGDGTFTTVVNWPNGRNTVATMQVLDVPAAVLPGATTAQNVRVRFRFRALGPDPSGGRDADGMIVNDFRLEWRTCDRNLCAPGAPGMEDGASRGLRTTGISPASPARSTAGGTTEP